MAATYRIVSRTNAYLPAASGYVISYGRKPEMFRLNEYIQYVEAPLPSFWYYKINPDQPIRVIDPRDFVWVPGADRPEHNGNQPMFALNQSWVTPYNYNITVPTDTLEFAEDSFGAKKIYLSQLTSQAMTARTSVVWSGNGGNSWNGLDTASTWPTGSIASANDLNAGAGNWVTAGSDPANPATYMAIRKSIMAATTAIRLNTNGNVLPKDLCCVISPNLARLAANSDEIRDFYKYGPFAKEAVENQSAELNDNYGMPKMYGGVKIVVEDASILTDRPTAAPTTFSTNRGFIKNDTNAVIVSRPGKIDAQTGPSFSTVQGYWYGDQLAVEEFDDPKHRRSSLNVVDQFGAVGPALEAGFCIQNCS